MFKDTLKNKYNKFGSIDDVVAKSKELDMAPRLPVIFYCLTNNIYIIGENRTLRLYWCHM